MSCYPQASPNHSGTCWSHSPHSAISRPEPTAFGSGPGSLVLPQRDPLLVAKQAATVSHLSGGRLTLAVGVGYIKQEYAYLRADFGNRGRLADEYISAMRELFESDTPEFHGPHINYSDVLFSPRPSARIPILGWR